MTRRRGRRAAHGAMGAASGGASRTGIALAAALYFILVVGVLAVAALFATARFFRAQGLRAIDASLVAAGDDILAGAVESWNPSDRGRLAVGGHASEAAAVSEAVPAAGAIRVTRLAQGLFWLVADVRSSGGADGRHLASLVARVPPLASGYAPLVAAGDIDIEAPVRLTDDAQPRAGCRAGLPASRAVVLLAPDARVIRSPGLIGDSLHVAAAAVAADSMTYLAIGADDWRTLAARAELRLPPGASTPAADHALAWAAGDLTLDGGSGAGVLLVDGRLTLRGPLTFSGIIVARGGVVAIGDTVVIVGALLSAAPSAAAGGRSVEFNVPAELRRSPCLIEQALASAVRPVPIRSRAWAELFR